MLVIAFAGCVLGYVFGNLLVVVDNQFFQLALGRLLLVVPCKSIG